MDGPLEAEDGFKRGPKEPYDAFFSAQTWRTYEDIVYHIISPIVHYCPPICYMIWRGRFGGHTLLYRALLGPLLAQEAFFHGDEKIP